MRSNIFKVSERGERLDSLQDKTDNLAVSAQGFRRGANRVRKQMWWKDMKMRVCLIICIIVLLVVIIVPSGTSSLATAIVYANLDSQSSQPRSKLRTRRSYVRHGDFCRSVADGVCSRRVSPLFLLIPLPLCFLGWAPMVQPARATSGSNLILDATRPDRLKGECKS